ncbi:MAG: hypothetical protein IJ993_00035 [Akkermansia sp.]|nr:hypothetical protein [Akkermansia sp.]
MKSLLLILSVMLTLLPLHAATARSYDDALRKASGGKPIVLFCYGANYDKVSEQAYETFIRKRGIANATRQCVFLEVPVYQLPNEKEKKEWQKVMGKHTLPAGIWSYPCLAVVDSSGSLRGVVQSAEEMKNPETATAALNKLLLAFDDQEKILKKAVRASGSKRMGLLAQAADEQATLPSSLSGGTPFDPVTVVEALQPMTHEEANNYVRQLIASGYYSRRQRQEIMAAYAGHIRRNGGSANRLRAIYTEMRNIDPTSIYGAYAEGAIALWVVPKEEDPSLDKPYKTLAQRQAEEKKKQESGGSTPTGSTDDEGWTPMGSSKKPGADTKQTDGPMGSTKK